MATPWRVPPMWQGKTVAVLASGESMSSAVAQAVRAARLPALVTNDTFLLAPWADVLYGADSTWWVKRGQRALKFAGLKVTACDSTPFRAVDLLRNTGKEGFDPDPTCVRTGGNGGYQAVHLAVHAGAARVLLCGFDMRGGHWHDPHEFPLRTTGEATFRDWIERFETLLKPLAARGVEVLNCTPGSALRCFPMVELDAELEAVTC